MTTKISFQRKFSEKLYSNEIIIGVSCLSKQHEERLMIICGKKNNNSRGIVIYLTPRSYNHLRNHQGYSCFNCPYSSINIYHISNSSEYNKNKNEKEIEKEKEVIKLREKIYINIINGNEIDKILRENQRIAEVKTRRKGEGETYYRVEIIKKNSNANLLFSNIFFIENIEKLFNRVSRALKDLK